MARQCPHDGVAWEDMHDDHGNPHEAVTQPEFALPPRLPSQPLRAEEGALP